LHKNIKRVIESGARRRRQHWCHVSKKRTENYCNPTILVQNLIIVEDEVACFYKTPYRESERTYVSNVNRISNFVVSVAVWTTINWAFVERHHIL